MDAGVGMRAGYREVIAYRRAHRSGRLPVRTTQCLLGGPGGIVEQAYADGVVSGLGDPMLRVGPVKIFTDGSAGGRTAAMTEPYLGEPETRGLMLLRDNEMTDLVHDYHAKGYQLAVHAIGDAAIEQTLDAFERALEAMPDPDRRHRIEHAGFARPDQNARMVRLGVQPVPQPVFIHDFRRPLRVRAGELEQTLLPAQDLDRPRPQARRRHRRAGLRHRPLPELLHHADPEDVEGNGDGRRSARLDRRGHRGLHGFRSFRLQGGGRARPPLPGLAADVAVFSRDLLTASPRRSCTTPPATSPSEAAKWFSNRAGTLGSCLSGFRRDEGQLSASSLGKRTVCSREEFRAPAGVRKSPRNEPAGHRRSAMGFSAFG
jgi:hypothetical protein